MSAQASQWKAEFDRLKGQVGATKGRADSLAEKGASPDQIANAGLTELAAVKQYNDFLATSRRLDESVRQLDARLRNDTNMSSLERSQYEIWRDKAQAQADEFKRFLIDNNAHPESAVPVKFNGKRYYDDGSIEWDTTTLRGALGSTLENAGSAFSSALDWLTPTNATKQLACAEGINNLVGAVTGKILPSPAGAADPVASKMLEDVWDQAKGSAMQPGEGVCLMLQPKNDPVTQQMRDAGLISELQLPGEFGEQYVGVMVAATDVALALAGGELATRVSNGEMSAADASALLDHSHTGLPSTANSLVPHDGPIEFEAIEELAAEPDHHAGSGMAVLGSVQATQALLQAIEAGDTRAIITSSAALLANLDRLSGNALLPDGVAPGLTALASALNLATAIQNGDGLAIAASSLNLGSQAAALYAGMLKEQGVTAFLAESEMAGALLGDAAMLGKVGGALAVAASVVSLVMAIEDGQPHDIASAALGVVAAGLSLNSAYYSAGFVVAWAAVAVQLIGSAIFEEDLPTLRGEATAVWHPDGSIQVLKTVDDENGADSPAGMLQGLVDAVQKSLAEQVDAHGNALYALIPQRLPTIGFILDPDGGRVRASAGHYYLKWIDESGHEQTRYYDGNGLRDDRSQASLAQDFMARAFSAVVPAWEAETVLAHMRDAGALTPGATGTLDENLARVAAQWHSAEWQAARPDAGMPREDADGIHQHFTALTVDFRIEPPAGVGTGRIGRNVDLDAYIEQTDWVKANQGILSIDVNGDGIISQNEILTNDPDAAGSRARNSLQWLDVNHDGRLDASDPAFAALGIWLDVNRNGQTDDGEFASFLDRGIVGLDFTRSPPILLARDGTALDVTEQHLRADVRGDYYQSAFADTDGDGKADAFAGVLHAHEGGETVLNAVVTHDYTGEAGHVHGGLSADGGQGELKLDAGDSRVQTASRKQHEQGLAEDVVAAGAICVSDGAPAAAGVTTSTDIGAEDSRLTSGNQTHGASTTQRTDTVRANDARVTGNAPTNANDAFAAIREGWIKSGDSLFGGTGALMGVAAGTVAGVADAAPSDTSKPASDSALQEPAGNNTVSHVPADTALRDVPPSEAPPLFIPGVVESLSSPPSHGGPDVAEVLTVDLSASQIQSVPTPPGPTDTGRENAALAPQDGPIVPGSHGESVRLVPPDVIDEQVVGVEDTRYTFDAKVLLENDSSKNYSSRPLQLTSVFGAEHGTVSMVTQPDGSQRIVFTPDQDYWGPARFRYVVTDDYGLESQGRVYLDILSVNDAPVANGESSAMDEDSGILFTSAQLLANDFDVDTPTVGDVLSILKVSNPLHGQVALDAEGNVRFLPDPDYFGPASFTYWVSDGNGGLTPATVSLEIRPVNDAPVANGEAIATDEDTVLLIGQAALLANDTDVDNAHSDLSIFSVRNGKHGTVELTADGLIRFVPEQDFFGIATFFYMVTDGAGGYTEAMATVNLAPVNDAPIVTGEKLKGNEDEALTIASAALLANDRDVDDPHASLTLVAVGNALHGEVRLNQDGSVSFIPDADYFGPASFEYTVSDPHGARTTGRVDIDLAPVNDAPRVRDEVIQGTEDTALTIGAAVLLANDTDVDNPHTELSITRVGGATHGSVSINPDGTIRFVPDRDFFGDATFQYDVSDGVGGVATATATIHVAAVNDAPIANDNVVNSRRGVAVTISAAALLADDYDIDNPHADLRIVGVSDAQHGTVRLNADGSVTFLPEPGYGGYPGAHGQFTYTISDDAGGFASATTTINLERINTTPVAVDDGFSGYENVPFVINTAQLLANDNDPDGDPLRVTQVGNAQHGTVEIQSDGQVRFTPDADFHGRASFQYLVSDSYGGETWATAFLDVAHVNKAPIIEAVEYGRAIFGYYYGPPVVEGRNGPSNGGGYYYSNGATFQPVYDEAMAISLAAQGKLLDAESHPYSPAHYRNGMLKPLALDQMDGDWFRLVSASHEADRPIVHANDPLRQMGRIIAYDPDGDSAAIVISIVQGPQHGYAYDNAFRETRAGFDGFGTLVNRNGCWQYESHLGDPYNGQDTFRIRITDAQGAHTEVVIHSTHQGSDEYGRIIRGDRHYDGNNYLLDPDAGGDPLMGRSATTVHVHTPMSEAMEVTFPGGGTPPPEPAVHTEDARTAISPEAPDVSSAPGPFMTGEETQRAVNLFVQMMNTEMTPTSPIGFVPPPDDTLASHAARAAQAATVDLGLAQSQA